MIKNVKLCKSDYHLWLILPKIIDSMKFQVMERQEGCNDLILISGSPTVCIFNAEKVLRQGQSMQSLHYSLRIIKRGKT